MRVSSLLLVLFVSSLLIATCLNEKVSFKGYKLIRVYPKNLDDIKFIQNLENKDANFDVWTADKDAVDVMLPPNLLKLYLGLFRLKKMEYEIVQQDVQAIIEEQEESMKIQKEKDSSKNIINTYARYTAINSFLDDTVDENPQIASTYNAGNSIEGRELRVIRLKTAQATRSIWMDCGIHAREWVSPAVCVYFIDRIIREYKENDPLIVALMNKYEFHILPVLNPDGYEFTHTNNRLWRKNRKQNSGSICLGVDLNRNFVHEWNPNNGASSLPCSETYNGAFAGSEPETQAVMSAINNRTGNWDAYLTLHSYGNLWLLPYGYTFTPTADNEELMEAAGQSVDAIKATHGQDFVYGPASTTLYISSGSSRDWAYGAKAIKYTSSIELRPGPGTPDYSFGFQLPVDRMPFVSNETYAGLKTFLNVVLNKNK